MQRNLICVRSEGDLGGGAKTTKKAADNSATEKTVAEVGSYEDLTSSLGKIDKLYSTSYAEPELNLPDTLGTQKIEYAAPQADEFYKQARTNLAEKYYAKADSVRSNAAENSNSIYDKINQAELKALFETRDLNGLEDEDRREIRKNALERGLARSSIVESAESDAEQKYDSERASVSERKEADVNSLKQKLENLKSLTGDALSALGVSQDLETQKLALNLYNEALEKQEEILKYNNALSSDEAKYQTSNERLLQEAQTNEYKRAAQAQKLLEELGEAGLERIISREKYYAVIAYIDGLTKEQSQDLLEKRTDLKDELGGFYDWVVDYVENKN